MIFDGYEGWMAQAACRDETAYDVRLPEKLTKKERAELWGYIADQLFFDRAGYEVARWACAVCPVRIQCLEYACRLRPEDGLFAALSPEERRGKMRTEWPREGGLRWKGGRELLKRSHENVRRVREESARRGTTEYGEGSTANRPATGVGSSREDASTRVGRAL